MDQSNLHINQQVNWRQVGLFILLTFGLSWAINLLLWLTAGYGQNIATLITLQAQMLMPAFAAIVLGMFVFKNSPIYFRNYRERPRWFFYFFLGYALIYLVFGLLVVLRPELGTVLSAISSSLSILGLMVLVALRAFSGREAFARAGLAGGEVRHWVLYGSAFVLFYVLQTALNAAFDLGRPVDIAAVAQSIGAGEMPVNVFIFVSAVQSILVGPLIGLLLGFGEEYGWRGYLQGELIGLGKRRGILLLGLIWSVWHYPVIWMGHNYPGQPVSGTVLMTGYTTLLAFVLGYVMLKTGSIWLVSFLHALNNQTYSYLNSLVYQPDSPVFSFGAGIYGLITLAVIVLLLLRDPVWQEPGTGDLESEPTR